MSKYTEQEAIGQLNIDIKTIESLYKSKCINWIGKTKDSKKEYTEVISSELTKQISFFNKIKPLTRKHSYFREDHCNIKIEICKSNRDEENFAKRITDLELSDLGLIIDFQVPLKDTRKDYGVGKIDLVSFNKNNKSLFLIELKYIGNKETLLRAILESYTYYLIVDKNKLKNDFIEYQSFKQRKAFKNIDVKEIKLIPAVLLVPGCNSYNELKEMESGDRPCLKAFSKALGIRFFILDLLINDVKL